MTEHTKTPWALSDEYPECIYSEDATGSIIATCGGFEFAPRPAREKNANAKHIVLCVNSHDALVKALERAMTYVELTCDEEAGEEAAAARDDLATCRAALSAARAPATER